MTFHRHLHRFLALLLLACILLLRPPVAAQSSSVHLTMGNPSNAVADASAPAKYLIVRDQYALSYHRDRGLPNWVSWHLDRSDLGDTPRYSGSFITDTSLPPNWYRVTHGDYTNSGYDRGHLTPSADRTASEADNQATFLMTNIIPQAPANNQGVWANLEGDSRELVGAGNELYIIAGGVGTVGTIAAGKVAVPADVWKVILVLPAGDNDVTRVTTATQLIAVTIPNTNTVGADWTTYTTSVDCIEQATGYDLLAALDDAIEATLEVQGGTCTIAPTDYRLRIPMVRNGVPAVQPSPMPTSTPTTAPTTGPTSTPTTSPTSSPTLSPSSTPTSPPAIGITIVEVLADPSGIDADGEYVRIRNDGASTVTMTGWTLRDLANATFTFPTFTLAPGAEVRVWVRSGVNDATNLYWGRGSAVWNNDGDTAILRDASGVEVARLSY